MARQVIEIGLQGNDGSGDSIREAFRKTNDNFRDLYAVFGKGGQIAFTDLDDGPSTYSANQLLITDTAGSSIVTRTIQQGTGVVINNDATAGTLTIGLASGGLSDTSPSILGPLNCNGLPIAKVAVPSNDAVSTWNLSHPDAGTPITIDDLVITKGYADGRYLLGGSSVPVRVRTEPANATSYIKTVESWSGSGNATITAHGFTEANNGFYVRFDTTGTPPSILSNAAGYYIRYATANEVSLHPTETDAKNNTAKIVVSDQGTGTQTLSDYYYDPSLSGYYLGNEALPRSKSVRRDGDTMTGILTLSGAPTADLHAATKKYVDDSILTKDNSDEITEGTTNLYFLKSRAQDSFTAGTGISFGAVDGNGRVSIASSITQYTDSLARAAVSVTDSGGDGSLSYDNGTGVFTYTGPSATEVRAHFSQGTGITITTGTIAVDSTVITTSATGTVTNTMLANNSVTIGSTSVALGATATTFTGLTSVTSGKFAGRSVFTVQALTGLDGTGVTLTSGQITGNLLTGEPTANSFLTLPDAAAAVEGVWMVVRNRSATYTLTVRDTSLATIFVIPTNSQTEIACDGISWFVI